MCRYDYEREGTIGRTKETHRNPRRETRRVRLKVASSIDPFFGILPFTGKSRWTGACKRSPRARLRRSKRAYTCLTQHLNAQNGVFKIFKFHQNVRMYMNDNGKSCFFHYSDKQKWKVDEKMVDLFIRNLERKIEKKIDREVTSFFFLISFVFSIYCSFIYQNYRFYIRYVYKICQ